MTVRWRDPNVEQPPDKEICDWCGELAFCFFTNREGQPWLICEACSGMSATTTTKGNDNADTHTQC